MAKDLVRDYYRVKLPGDCAEDLDSLGTLAIDEARERAKLYVMPCRWEATHIAGEVGDFSVEFRVCRIRRKKRPTL